MNIGVSAAYPGIFTGRISTDAGRRLEGRHIVNGWDQRIGPELRQQTHEFGITGPR